MQQITDLCDVCGSTIDAQEKSVLRVAGHVQEHFQKEFITDGMWKNGTLEVCKDCMRIIFCQLKNRHSFKDTMAAIPTTKE